VYNRVDEIRVGQVTIGLIKKQNGKIETLYLFQILGIFLHCRKALISSGNTFPRPANNDNSSFAGSEVFGYQLNTRDQRKRNLL